MLEGLSTVLRPFWFGKPRSRHDVIPYNNTTGKVGETTVPIRELHKSSQEKYTSVEHKLQRKGWLESSIQGNFPFHYNT